MAYALSGLRCIGDAGDSPRMWIYSTTDAIATVNTAAYFNSAADLLSVRDIIWVCDTSLPQRPTLSAFYRTMAPRSMCRMVLQ